MAICLKHTHRGPKLFCLVILACYAIPLQITGQSTNKIESNMLNGVKNVVSLGGLKLDVCFQTHSGFFCCSNGHLCYDTLQECLSKCVIKQKVRRGLGG
uniref:Uncharacterized protein n=1 Tax=Leersia perrieri TaxID=77586 RepID=A0A0D9XRT9_9ORYZ